ncbi:hypothetical protein DYBT9275_01266 [Dyadobacter sp. CECT 9275]|uniref:N-acetyltransferase domain-containing protein n=1 Tax=Dyadobacter helix TaxID=2822344 RepID=A0A916J8L6_9BACT|nr:GNAT family N-acetyltransferase [Dyadobacter sp. CECT 9275]CAG4993937.1 hypothetical protein DYBT9275_01266 [Dyadobacter sp. CECT 9275]
MQLQIREFNETDRGDLRKLYLEVRRQSFGWLEKDNFIKDTFDRDTEGETVLVAVNGSEIIGFISVCPQENFIHHIYVATAYQRQGVGEALLRSVRDLVEYPVRLKCLQNNTGAVEFYKKGGWIPKNLGISAEGIYILFELQKEIVYS